MRIRRCTIALAAVLLLSLPVPSSAVDALTIGRPDDLISSLSARILEEAYQRIDIDVHFVGLPAERALIQANSGKTDGEVNRIIGMDKTYPNLIRVSAPVNVNQAVVFSKNHDFVVNGWESLRPYTIAVRIGIKFVEQGTRGMKVFRFVSNEQIFSLVAEGRYDVCIASRLTGQYEIQRLGLKGIKALSPPLATFNLYHYLHKKHKDVVPRINGVLEAMHREGRMHRIREQFVGEMLRPLE